MNICRLWDLYIFCGLKIFYFFYSKFYKRTNMQLASPFGSIKPFIGSPHIITCPTREFLK